MDLIVKYDGRSFMPIVTDEKTERWLSTLKGFSELPATISQPRNGKFHRKLFGLLNIAFDICPEPEEVEYAGKMIQPEKDFDKFREWVTIMAGYYHPVWYPDGSFRMVADSISFASMKEDTFEELYNKVITVILNKVIPLAPKQHWEAYSKMVLEFD